MEDLQIKLKNGNNLNEAATIVSESCDNSCWLTKQELSRRLQEVDESREFLDNRVKESKLRLEKSEAVQIELRDAIKKLLVLAEQKIKSRDIEMGL